MGNYMKDREAKINTVKGQQRDHGMSPKVPDFRGKSGMNKTSKVAGPADGNKKAKFRI